MARTKVSARLEREAREAEASRAGGGEDEGGAGSGEKGGGCDEDHPVQKEACEGISDRDEDEGAEKRSEWGDDGRRSGEGQGEGGAVDIEMGDGDEGEECCTEEGRQARELDDVITPRKSKRAAPAIELSKDVSTKQKNALTSDIEGIEGPPPTKEIFEARVQDHVDNEEAVAKLRETIPDEFAGGKDSTVVSAG